MDESEKGKNVLRPYYIVEFVSRGRRPAIKKIDVVVGTWLFVNNKTKTPATKFPEEPYENLQLYLENRLQAPASWPSYTIKVRGRADTLDEAFVKLSKIMKDGETTLTMSSEESAAEAEKKEIDKIHQMQFIDEANHFKKSVSSVPLDVPKANRTSLNTSTAKKPNRTKLSLSNASNQDNEVPSKSSSDSTNIDGLLSVTSSEEEQIEEENSEEDPERQTSATSQNQFTTGNFDDIQTQLSVTSMRNVPVKTYKNVNTNQPPIYEKEGTTLIGSSVKSTGSSENAKRSVEILKALRTKQQKRKSLRDLTNTSNSPIRKKPKCDTQTDYQFQDVVIDYLMYLVDTVDEIHAQHKSNTDEIASIKTLLLKQAINENVISNRTQLADKYSYVLPFRTVQSFQEFDEKLEDSKSTLRSDVKNMLLSGLDSNLVISKCMVNMLKMVLSREVAMQYTAVKEIKDKHVMTNTNFYSCMEEIIKERRMASKLSATDKDFKSGLSSVLTNASGWKSSSENQKRLRKSPRKSRKPSEKSTRKKKSDADASDDDLTGDDCATQGENSLNASNPNLQNLEAPKNFDLTDTSVDLNNHELLGLFHTLPIRNEEETTEFDFDNLFR